ncbi:hypothetical protein DRN73_02790 [Candidatus Pacearchaeota archaeon]|nr:MAG: hypothetical protein DRN73_02790 [Candidatus Pacearchaeota archaeon]
MEQMINIKGLMEKLIKIQTDIDYIREHLEDTTLTKDDLIALEKSEKEFVEKKTISHKDLKRELGL